MSKNKPWDSPIAGRAKSGSRQRRKILIACEDSKSARMYFESFPIDEARIEINVAGTGMNTDSLIEEAIRLKQTAAKKKQPYSQIWCVFDRDSFPMTRYARAFQLASANSIEVAWTNEAFELWYLLHYCYVDSAIKRTQYKQKLKAHGLAYDKADEDIYSKVIDRQSTALRNAAKLEKHWIDCGIMGAHRSNPSTRVHKLVEFLNDLAELK